MTMMIGILLPPSMLTYSSSSTWRIASAYQMSSKSVNPRRSYDVISIFQDGGHGGERSQWRRKSTPACGFGDGTCLRRSKSIRIPNFDEIGLSLSAVELLLLPVSKKNKRPPYFASDFTTKRPFYIFEPPWGLRATYDDHLRLIGKRIVDFLLALIELFSLDVTAEALRANIG